MLQLVKTTMAQQEQVLAFLQEWRERKETIVPNAVDRDASDFASYVKQIRDKESRANIEAGWVPSTTYWLTDGDELLGAANIRHELNAHLLNFGDISGMESSRARADAVWRRSSLSSRSRRRKNSASNGR
ncbi:GNAT family N-acetyltransferase [Exiguobacterium mexicanum]|uniref:GNAT family N-acetyltransferase n=1 Tax=Exiguobacterium mexicanum TaxID=340146 RepID=UPI0037C059CB